MSPRPPLARLAAVLFTVVLLVAGCKPQGYAEVPAATPTPIEPPKFTSNPYCTSGVLCSTFPGDQIMTPDGCLSSDQQCSRDFYSWQSFVSLNWPGIVGTDKTVQPDSGKSVGDAGNRVWELWMDPDSVFLPGAKVPTWNPGQSPPLPCTAAAPGKAIVGRLAKASVAFGDSIDPNDFFEATIQQPLIDQNLEFVLFEIRMSESEVGWVVTNKLYQQETVDGLTKEVQFPNDSIEAKAAWRILPAAMPQAQKDRYYHAPATIVLDPSHVEGGGTQPVCVTRDLGLVGLHIRHNGLWSTFEQVDNVTAHAGFQPTFNNPACTNCAVNLPPTDKQGKPIPSDAYKWSLNGPSASLYEGYPNVPSQITRAIGEDKIIDQRLNDWWQQSVVQGTVWANYMLITTNWIEFPLSSQPIPALNTALEPYIPNPTPAPSPTPEYPQACIECHKLATNGNGALIGQSFLPFRACPTNPKPGQKLPPNCVPQNVDTLASHH